MLSSVREFLAARLQRPVRFANRLWIRATERLLNIETGHSASGPGANLHLPDHRGVNPRNIRIGYLKPVHEHVVEEESWLERYADYKTPTASRMVFWRSRIAS